MDAKLTQHVGASLGAVAANYHDPVDAALGQVAQGLGAPAFLAELGRSSAAEEGATDLDDAADVTGAELAELAIHQTLPALAHAVDRHVLIERAAGYGANCRIHSRSVTTTSQNCDVLHN